MADNPKNPPDNWEPVEPTGFGTGTVPPAPQYPMAPNPWLRSPLPASAQLSPDSLRQFHNPSTSQRRLQPSQASGQAVVLSAAQNVVNRAISNIVAGPTSFDLITTGTNVIATMTVGTGGILTFSGSGIVNASQWNGTPISGTPGVGKVPVGTGAAAVWGDVPGFPQTVTAVVDFDFSAGNEGDLASVTVAAPWVTAGSIILCSAQAKATVDHSADDVIIEDLNAFAENIVPGVGFDIVVIAPQNTFGKYDVQALGVA